LRKSRTILVALTVLIELACIPVVSTRGVPAGITDRIPEGIGAESAEVLAMPVWWDDGDYLINQAERLQTGELDTLRKQMPKQWNYYVADITAHSAGHVRYLSCMYLVFDTGQVLWMEHDAWDAIHTKRGNPRYEFRWMNAHIGTLGPRWRADLIDTLEGKEPITVPRNMQTPGQFWFIDAPSPERLEALRRLHRDWDIDETERNMYQSFSALIQVALSKADRRSAIEFVTSIPMHESSSDAWTHSPPVRTEDGS
jgi:hypothetical protein